MTNKIIFLIQFKLFTNLQKQLMGHPLSPFFCMTLLVLRKYSVKKQKNKLSEEKNA